jgi:multidrug transporter EmrE-like cation transporter
MKEVFFCNFYVKETGAYDWYYILNIIMRIVMATVSVYSSIRSIHFAILANINFGIISCCFIISVVINSTCGYFFFGEKLNAKVVGGIAVTISGILWISLAKG